MFTCFNLVPLDSVFFDIRGAVLIYANRKSALEMLLTCSPTPWVKNMLSFPGVTDEGD